MSNRAVVHGRIRVGVLACAGMAAVAISHAESSDERLPFYLQATHTVMRDSNFSRTDDAQGETVNSTAALLGLSKAYGRQQYQLSTQLSRNRYQHYGELLNNSSKLLNGTFSSEFLANWQLSVGGNYSQNLNPIKDNVNQERVVKNIRTYNSRNVSLRYGLDADWSLTATGDANTVRYSRDAYRGYNADQHTAGLRVNYYATDRLVYGLGYRKVSTHYVASANDRTLNEQNIDLSANWQITGLSNLSAQVTRRRTSYSDDSLARTRSWNGNLAWAYTPNGFLSYRLGASRYSGTDRVDTVFTNVRDASGRTDTINMSTNYNASVTASVSPKTKVTLASNLIKSRYNYTAVYQNLGFAYCLLFNYCDRERDVSSVYHSTTLSAQYQGSRSFGGQCNLSVYSQTRDRYNIRYQGRSIDCSVSLTLDSLSPLVDSFLD